ncbi:adenylylsulfate kinase-like enzyme [Diaminobutyricimonas aerilata]|uniref:Adenylylsulfate kinase-like enzyme n=1 Tax=Diaminobutyricimonas aerilata TaxID=1162967 RepID=A0A2M9CNH2_9MICO|nr:adenylyl-sulfate kinase [Diaminobutyricimonas aerilata]PJJ73447.1 adenylylsulfate kinase-like enzyme [Diaminobutyricimonas aerilata]
MRTLLLNGTVGAGKTTAMDALGHELRRRGVRHTLVDVDGLRQSWPAPPEDPFHLELTLRNLAAVAANAAAAGTDRLVLAGVLESAAERARYADAVGGDLTVVRIAVPIDTVIARLTRRHADDPDGLAWHLRRAPELAAILDAAGADDHVIEAGRLTPRTLAEHILDLWK